jgi:hypothetical protein
MSNWPEIWPFFFFFSILHGALECFNMPEAGASCKYTRSTILVLLVIIQEAPLMLHT